MAKGGGTRMSTPTFQDQNGRDWTLAALVEHALLDHSLPLDARWALYYDVDLALESACRQLEADQKAQEQLEIEETRAHEKHLEALRRE